MSWQAGLMTGMGLIGLGMFYISFNLSTDELLDVVMSKLFWLLGFLTWYIDVGLMRLIVISYNTRIAGVLNILWEGMMWMLFALMAFSFIFFIVDMVKLFKTATNKDKSKNVIKV